MEIDLIEKAKRGDLSGMNIAILARLSDESKFRRHAEKKNKKRHPRPMTGLDINNREEQALICTRRIEAQGGQVIHVYHEPHTSASKRRRVVQPDGTVVWRVIRPVYKQAIADLTKGVVAENGQRVDGLMILDVDRLTRDNRDLEDAIDVVVFHHRPILEWRGSVDLLTDAGRTNARAVVAYKNSQSVDTGWRISNKHKAMQREGIPAGGTRPFGWKKNRRKLHPIEAPILRTAALEILGGRNPNSVVSEWCKHEILTANGKRWRRESLISVLRNPRICGYRMATVTRVDESSGEPYKRRVVMLDSKGKPVKGQWERIITPKQWHALLEILGEAPQRGTGHNARVHLLPGTIRCGREGCEQLMRSLKPTAKRMAGKPAEFFWYQCRAKSQGGCGGLQIDGPATDAYVIKAVIAKYEQQSAKRDAVAAPVEWDKQPELDRVREDMTALKAARKARKISAERYYADLNELEAEERALMREANAYTRRKYAGKGKRIDLRAEWENLSLEEQRAYIEQTLSAVVILPAGARRNVPVDERIVLVPANEGTESYALAA